jgi:hypothetical protein
VAHYVSLSSLEDLCRSRALSFSIARECGIERRFVLLENNTNVQGHDIYIYICVCVCVCVYDTTVYQLEESPFLREYALVRCGGVSF